jgi:hypothetical protein
LALTSNGAFAVTEATTIRASAREPALGFELALLLVLATLWGGSYAFIKLGVAAMTIPARKPAGSA